ncbi:MAG: signal peptidase I [bacterium]|nr:signal peptidase I [bacterium]
MRNLRKFLLNAWEVLEVVLIATATVLIIRTFLIQPFLVSGASMEPNFSDGNYLLIDEITYRFREPQRGETVVFRYPGDRDLFFIKRIVGLPGERVGIKDNVITIDGEALAESYYLDGQDIKTVGTVDITLDLDQYFVLGDNRYNSFDSRNWGPLTRNDITGLVRLRVLPISELELFSY